MGMCFAMMGAVAIETDEYLKKLSIAIDKEDEFMEALAVDLGF